MKTSHVKPRLALALLILVWLWAFGPSLLAKGGGVGFWMEGTVTNLTVQDDKIRFELAGRLWFKQYPNGREPAQEISMNCPPGTSVTIRQADPFFAMTSDWSGGAIRGEGALLRLLKAGEGGGRFIRFELTHPTLSFGRNHRPMSLPWVGSSRRADATRFRGSKRESTVLGTLPTILDAAVVRATDADLK